MCEDSVGIPFVNFNVGSVAGSPKQPEGHWEEGKNVQDGGEFGGWLGQAWSRKQR